MKRLGAVIAALLLASGCGGGKSYGDAKSVASAGGLKNCKATKDTLATDEVDCDPSVTSVLWFSSSDAVGGWRKIASQVAAQTGANSAYIYGSDWIIECPSLSVCSRLNERLGGKVGN